MPEYVDEYHYANVVSESLSKMRDVGGKTLVGVVKEVSPDIVRYLTSINIDMRTVALGADGYLLVYHAAPLLADTWTSLVEHHSRFAEMVAFLSKPQKALFISCDNATPIIRSLHDGGTQIHVMNGRSVLFFERFINHEDSPLYISNYTVHNADDILCGAIDEQFDFIYSQFPAIEEHWDNFGALVDLLNTGGCLLLSGAGLDGASVYAPSESGFEQHPYYFLHTKLKQRSDVLVYNFNSGFGATAVIKL